MESQLYTYKAEIGRIVDGDTVDFLVDVGFESFHQIRARLARINAPESNRKISMVKGKAATKYLTELLNSGDEETALIIKSGKLSDNDDNPLLKDSFGRWIVDVWVCLSGNWVNVNYILVSAGHAEYKDYS